LGGLVWRHFFDYVGRLLSLERFENAGLYVRIYFGQSVSRNFAIDCLENGFAVVRTELLDNVRQIGWMHLFEQLVIQIQLKPPLRIGLEDGAVLPADRVRRNGLL